MGDCCCFFFVFFNVFRSTLFLHVYLTIRVYSGCKEADADPCIFNGFFFLGSDQDLVSEKPGKFYAAIDLNILTF